MIKERRDKRDAAIYDPIPKEHLLIRGAREHHERPEKPYGDREVEEKKDAI
jgi:hypothetical protein